LQKDRKYTGTITKKKTVSLMAFGSGRKPTIISTSLEYMKPVTNSWNILCFDPQEA